MMPKGRKNEPKWLTKSMKNRTQNPCLKKLRKIIKNIRFSNPPNHEKRCFPAQFYAMFFLSGNVSVIRGATEGTTKAS